MTGATKTWTTPAGAASTRSACCLAPCWLGALQQGRGAQGQGSRHGVGRGQKMFFPLCLRFPHSSVKHFEVYR